MGGYQLAIAMDIFRGRYRESFETPKADPAEHAAAVHASRCRRRTTCSCPATGSWCRSSRRWFPLYDRNPQTFVPNIFFAKPEDYVKATQRIYHAAGAASFIEPAHRHDEVTHRNSGSLPYSPRWQSCRRARWETVG